ncbi:unnamed protein product [Mytilus edulis]|uniref:Uncharacterized protein n=1 Tax=Mytilus edulis TaxID=6550 RepID=A0A8S3RZM7_MYTED|nr:unnamed protein product [Mytilus edulis]
MKETILLLIHKNLFNIAEAMDVKTELKELKTILISHIGKQKIDLVMNTEQIEKSTELSAEVMEMKADILDMKSELIGNDGNQNMDLVINTDQMEKSTNFPDTIDVTSTNGIEIHTVKCKAMSNDGIWKKTEGDEEFYHTHQTFLSQDAIYLVVTNLNEADDPNKAQCEDINGHPDEQKSPTSWYAMPLCGPTPRSTTG